MKRLSALCGAILLLMPALAAAQLPPASSGPYAIAGAGWASKAPGDLYDCSNQIANPNASCDWKRFRLATLVVGAGVPVVKHLSLEVAAERTSMPDETDIAWRWSYTAPVTNNIASHRDTPILLLVRYEPGCLGRVCIEPVAGAGIAIHQAESIVISECGSIGVPLPCTPPTTARRTDETSLKFAWAFGLNVRVRVSNRVWLQPVARFTFISDGYELFDGNQRGPNTGSPWVRTVGLTVMIR